MPKRVKPEIVDVVALRAALAAAEAQADQATQRADEAQAAVDRAEAEATAVKARLAGDTALIAHLRERVGGGENMGQISVENPRRPGQISVEINRCQR